MVRFAPRVRVTSSSNHISAACQSAQSNHSILQLSPLLHRNDFPSLSKFGEKRESHMVLGPILSFSLLTGLHWL